MTTIDEIMFAADLYARYESSPFRDGLAQIITQALAEARVNGFRNGAEAMREELATACGSTFTTISGRDEVELANFDNEKMSATEIRDWPLCATAKREPVRLTDADVIREVCLVGMKIQMPDGAKQLCRAIETAVLTANGLTK